MEIQLAALEVQPSDRTTATSFILTKAEELEIPILSVDLDTLTTVEIVDRTFGQVRLHEPIKCNAFGLMAKHFDVDRLLSQLD